mmetsp:Transcript_48092/g.160281  ORF Transcript_48092/g.160281 Transcript_48092/m.160281 type:complete len:433 (+) Transcript_48092:1049-2347(+)
MVGVLFDFDGTLGDTEAPAMDVAFWELAPFMPSLELLATDPAGLDAARDAFVVENAGKAFEFMLEKVDAERAASGGLLPIEQAWARDLAACALTASPLAAAVDTQRAKLGLKTLADIFSASAAEPTLLAQQKADTNARLAIAATPTPNTPAALEALVKATCAVPPSRGPTSCSSSHEKPLASASPQAGVPFVIATTSGKPRVPICVDACGFRAHFPSDDANIHSGESDFDPPRFKPAPDVYLRAASYVGGGGGLPPARCVAGGAPLRAGSAGAVQEPSRTRPGHVHGAFLQVRGGGGLCERGRFRRQCEDRTDRRLRRRVPHHRQGRARAGADARGPVRGRARSRRRACGHGGLAGRSCGVRRGRRCGGARRVVGAPPELQQLALLQLIPLLQPIALCYSCFDLVCVDRGWAGRNRWWRQVQSRAPPPSYLV